jgi:hypothetical protein
MRVNYTPLQLVSGFVSVAGLIALYFGWIEVSQNLILFFLLWNALSWALESTGRRSDVQQRGLIALVDASSRYTRISVMLMLASNEDTYKKAHEDFTDWFNSTFDTVREFFSLEEAERFRVIGNETPATMVLQLNQLRPYTERNKEILSQQLAIYGDRLSELLKLVPSIKKSFTVPVVPMSPSARPSASLPGPK